MSCSIWHKRLASEYWQCPAQSIHAPLRADIHTPTQTLTSSIPCDTPIYPPEELAASNDGMFLNAGFDFSQLSPGYASKVGIYDPDRAAERATQVRHWLRQRPEREIVCE